MPVTRRNAYVSDNTTDAYRPKVTVNFISTNFMGYDKFVFHEL
jgi:hypothetical protein